jgi:hypothetical protein
MARNRSEVVCDAPAVERCDRGEPNGAESRRSYHTGANRRSRRSRWETDTARLEEQSILDQGDHANIAAAALGSRQGGRNTGGNPPPVSRISRSDQLTARQVLERHCATFHLAGNTASLLRIRRSRGWMGFMPLQCQARRSRMVEKVCELSVEGLKL